MPPKASTGRRSSREPDPSVARPKAFVKPRLPLLPGTPSSRRQYTYGSGVEPPPRVGHGLQRMDLRTAVNQVLTRSEEDEPSHQPSKSKVAEKEAAEDAGANPLNQEPATNLSSHAGDYEDSLRSYGMESDYYGDANLEATPRVAPTPESRPAASRLRRQALEKVSENTLPVASPAKAPQRPPTSVAKTQPVRTEVGRGRESAKSSTQPPPQQSSSESDDESIEADEMDTREAARGHLDAADTPAPNRVREATLRRRRAEKEATPPQSTREQNRRSTEREGESAADRLAITKDRISRLLGSHTLKPPNTPGAVPAPTKHLQVASPPAAVRRQVQYEIDPGRNLRENSRRNQDPSGRSLRSQQQTSEPLSQEPRDRSAFRQRSAPTRGSPGLFAQREQILNTKNSLDAPPLPDDPVERDAQIQQEIREAEEQWERQERQHRLAAERESRRRRWDWFMSLWPMSMFQRFRRTNEEVDYQDHLAGVDAPTEWVRLLYPMTYIRSLVWAFDQVMDYVVSLLDRLHGVEVDRRLPRRARSFFWDLASIIVAILGVGILILFATPVIQSLTSSWSSSNEGSGIAIDLPRWDAISDKFGSFVPSISWPSSKVDDLSDLWESDEEDGEKRAAEIVKRFEQEFSRLRNTNRLHHASLQKLETVVPKVVLMNLEGGKPVVAREFYYALRDLIRKDDQLLNVEKTADGYRFSSEEQWKSMVKRLNNDPAFAQRLKSDVASIEDGLESKMINTWDSWVKSNNKQISKLLGPALDKIQYAGSGKDLDKRLAGIVKEQLQGKELKKVVVTREEFLNHLQVEFARHRSEIRDELDQLKSNVVAVQEAVRLATSASPDGVSKNEVASLVQSIVRKTIADMNLGSLASGKIHQHWDADLKNQVNYFALGAGATIDAARTSPGFDLGVPDPYAKQFKSKIKSVSVPPPVTALQPWQDEGECFCAVLGKNRRGNYHSATLSIQLGYNVIPQHIVVEHILPGATTDPGARPKQIEVWAFISDHQTRLSHIRDFSSVHFPSDRRDWDYEDPGFYESFVKIGQFQYEHSELHDGVYVYRLSSELLELNAVTDQIIIRAVSNYGAPDHTCFYRVRMYGARPSIGA